jgi:hypothetical protein
MSTELFVATLCAGLSAGVLGFIHGKENGQIDAALERLKEVADRPLKTDQNRLNGIFVDLITMPELELFALQGNPCENVHVACMGAESADVRALLPRAVEYREHLDDRAAADRSYWIAGGSLFVSVFSVVLSVFGFFQKGRR